MDNKLEFINLIEILKREDSLEETTIHLLRHFRCVSHTNNLIITSNIDAYFVNKNQINKNNPLFQSLKKLHKIVLANLSKLWLKQNQSTVITECIHDIFEGTKQNMWELNN